MPDSELLAAYDAQVRRSFAHRVPARWTASQDGPMTRCLTPRGGFAMTSTTLEELGDERLGALIDRTVDFFAGAGRRFEWKTFDHDRAGLADALLARGFLPKERESLVLGSAQAVIREETLPPGFTMRQVDDRADLERIAALQSEVWGEDWSWLAEDLAGRLSDPEEPAVVFVIEHGGVVASAAWLVPLVGTKFAGLWGGSTLPEFRRRGLYQALVSRRARTALERGCTMLQVDASADSRPILETLGLHVVGGTTPYIWTPAGESAPGAVSKPGSRFSGGS